MVIKLVVVVVVVRPEFVISTPKRYSGHPRPGTYPASRGPFDFPSKLVGQLVGNVDLKRECRLTKAGTDRK